MLVYLTNRSVLTSLLAATLVGCLTYQQHASVSQGRVCSDNLTCCHTEIEVADQTFHLTQSQYTDTGTTSPSTDPITPGAWQGSHWSANFEVTGMTRPRKKSRRKAGFEPGIFRSRGGRLNHQANEAVLAGWTEGKRRRKKGEADKEPRTGGGHDQTRGRLRKKRRGQVE